MERISIRRLSWIPAALGLVLALPGVASAYCRHGWTHCWSCSQYGYGYSGTPAGVVPGGLPAVAGNTNGTVTPPAGVTPPTPPPSRGAHPALPGARQMSAPAAPASQAAFAAPASQGAYYYPGYYYAAPTAPYDGAYAPAFQGDAAAPGSFLGGYSNAAPIFQIRPGTRLFNGQLFGSHLFQVLQQFGGNLDRSGLLDLGVKAFMDASGVAPTNFERQIIEQVVSRFLGVGGNGGTGPTGPTGTNTTTVTANGTNVIQFLVTVEIKPVAGGAGIRTTVTPQTIAPGGDAVPPPPTVTPPTPPPSAPVPTPPVPADRAPTAPDQPAQPPAPAEKP